MVKTQCGKGNPLFPPHESRGGLSFVCPIMCRRHALMCLKNTRKIIVVRNTAFGSNHVDGQIRLPQKFFGKRQALLCEVLCKRLTGLFFEKGGKIGWADIELPRKTIQGQVGVEGTGHTVNHLLYDWVVPCITLFTGSCTVLSNHCIPKREQFRHACGTFNFQNERARQLVQLVRMDISIVSRHTAKNVQHK